MGAESDTLRHHFLKLGFNPKELSEQKKKEGIRNFLHVLKCPEAELQMNTGNAIFTDDKVQELQKFLDDAENLHQNFPTSVEAEDLINATDSAYGKLVDLIKVLDPEFVMVYINYIFLNAYTENPFYNQPTQEQDFFVDNVTTVKVEMMHKAGYYNTYHDQELSCEVVQIPYKSNASALFILPEPGKMRLVEEAMGEKLLQRWQDSLRPRWIDLYLPMLSQSIDAEEISRSLVTIDVFSDESGILRKAELNMCKAGHKAHMSIHKNGTEAAAAMFIELVQPSVPPEMKIYLPYRFVIYNEIINITLLFGNVVNPNEP
ncbi:alpha-1-antitrypsin-like [Heteronotia binoei]|uniref:alpha-1-antitrypsin-like n=1 Tax=Heteronotia binoei TaxID=13085 RepID=UPI00292FBFA4|nr:alpha-1-antitrypsin-like [Heteronotia binoei]